MSVIDYEKLYEETAEKLHRLKEMFNCDLGGKIEKMVIRYAILQSDIKKLPEQSEIRLRMEGEMEATIFWIIEFADLIDHFFPNPHPMDESECFAQYRKTMKEWPDNGLEFSFPEKHKPSG